MDEVDRALRKKLLILSLLILFILSLLSALNVNITMVSAGDYPAIYVEPETTEDPNLRPSMNYTISIKTDYTGNDPFTNYIISYEFTLSYDPSILNGVEVTNGDLIDGVGATFLAGPFDNEAGELSRTVAFYDPGGEVVSGPGTLAYVTFKVVGKGTSDITIGPTTQLIGWNWFAEPEYYPIIDAENMPTHIQQGTFDNRFPHDVAVVSLTAQAEAAVGSVVSISVEVANEGASDEDVEVVVSYDSAPIETKQVPLPAGESETVLFSWNTTGVTPDEYSINATATIEGDGDITDNWKTTPIRFVEHDVAVVSLTAQAEAAVGELVSINVTVANIGSSYEVANVTIRYDTTYIDSQNVTLLVGKNKTVSFTWNTTGVTADTYDINATATIPVDGDLTDNSKTKTIRIVEHDVAVTALDVPSKAKVGATVPINVTVQNQGASTETLNVTVSHDTTLIGFNDTTVLPEQNSTILSFSWNTTGVTPDEYSINATATILPTPQNPDGRDDDTTDNWNTTTILLAVHDVAVKHISAPTTVYAGEFVTIEVSVENLGGYNETFEVRVTYDTSIIEEPKSVILPSRVSKPIEFSWNTTGVAPDSYTITAEALLDGDVNPGDNRKTKPVAVELPPGNIAGTVMDASTGDPIGGANVTANGYSDITDANGHYNITDVPAGTYNVTASANGYQTSSSTNITVSAGEPTTVDFELKPAQPPNILLYAGAAAVAIVIIAGVAVYTLKVRKPT